MDDARVEAYWYIVGIYILGVSCASVRVYRLMIREVDPNSSVLESATSTSTWRLPLLMGVGKFV